MQCVLTISSVQTAPLPRWLANCLTEGVGLIILKTVIFYAKSDHSLHGSAALL